MYVACSTLCFSRLSLDDTFAGIREMHFPKADLAIHEVGPHLRPSEVAADVPKMAQKLKAANLPLAAFHVGIEATDTDEGRQHLRAVCRLARLSTVPLLTLPAPPAGADVQAETDRLREWCAVATSEGVILTVETHADGITADPAAAAELCKMVPGLGLTLDPSHYHVGPSGPQNYDALFPLVRHVRLRDTGTRPDQFQVRIGQGEMDYGRIVGQLARFGYDRALTVDVRDVPDSPFPVGPEVRKLKYLLESLV